jgi:hypothetical protein
MKMFLLLSRWCPLGPGKRTLAGKKFHQNGLTDISFDPPQFSLDRTFKVKIIMGIGSSPAWGRLGNFSTDFNLKDPN